MTSTRRNVSGADRSAAAFDDDASGVHSAGVAAARCGRVGGHPAESRARPTPVPDGSRGQRGRGAAAVFGGWPGQLVQGETEDGGWTGDAAVSFIVGTAR